ncbi:Tenascin [Cavenderia fasciculata]|uniref:Tenascin n=1 Tax=Cavenderia fasciculata TaxID=261658 RepID=F4Q842_CACFS|nr:Tenascin [Cavenderia fasciculata]EGG15942.1 Tenascin [Cavenderia fasciculata]|eukprot:XP_004352267.1 Tenascin [Cavenderia fasciculata]
MRLSTDSFTLDQCNVNNKPMKERKHSQGLNLIINSYLDVGSPNPDIVLYLPALEEISIIFQSGQVANQSINILKYLSTVQSLVTVNIQKDPSLTYIPNEFTNMANLDNLVLVNNGIKTVPVSLLTNMPKLSILHINEPIESVSIPSSPQLGLPLLWAIHFRFNLTIPYSINLSSQTFPSLSSMIITQNQYLVSLTMNDCNLKTYPFQSYPTSLQVLQLGNNLIDNVPSIPVPAGLTTFDVSNNSIVNFDHDTIFSNNRGLLLYLSNNLGFAGPITDSYCKHSLRVLNTSVSALPDCFWCYYNSTNQVIVTNLSLNPSFVCNFVVDQASQIFATNQSRFTITGNNIGWGHTQSGTKYILTRIIANKQLTVTFSPTPRVLTNYALALAPFAGAPSINISAIDSGFTFKSVRAVQSIPYTTITIELKTFNDLLAHNVTVDGVTNCNVLLWTSTTYNCSVYPQTQGIHQVKFFNDYSSLSYGLDFTFAYPIVNNVHPIIIHPQSIVTMTGNFGPNLNSPSVTLKNGIDQDSPCTIQSITPTTIIITQPPIKYHHNKFVKSRPIYCHGNGQCNTTGQCDCNSNAYYNNCSKPYPIISSASYNATNNKIISLNGDFGPYGQSNLSIKINNTLDCTVNSTSQQLIICELEKPPNYGLSSVQLQLDSLDTNAKDILYLRQPDNGGNNGTTTTSTGGSTDTPQQQCEKQTSNCYGHGVCDVNGICQCDKDFNPVDNCFTKFINTTITPNTTSPTVSFDIDGIDFQFEVVSIQELDLDSNIIKELFISNYTWIVNASTNNITTIVDYQLNTTLSSSSSSSDINSILFQSVSVLSTISFSTQSRDIQFGDQQLHINANSIKLSVNVTNWQYSSNLATLRVVFRTITINNQTVEYDCNEKEIDPLTYDSLSSLQYLRVIKDDIQFNGRFIDVALSDGRPTYSQTQLISLTQSTSNEDESIALIGINLPQCQSCILDPDFSPLLIDKSNDSGCEKSNTWRIIVGCVVGGVGAVAITVGSVLTYKQIKKRNTYNAKMEAKLKNIS